MPATSDEAACVQLLLTPGVGRRTLNRLLDAAETRSIRLADVPTMEETDLVRLFGLRSDVARAIRSSQAASAGVTERLLGDGISVLTRRSRHYPQRLRLLLKDDAPPVLFAWGALSVLNADGVAICGSRKCSKEGLELASRLAAALASEKLNVISGYAAGVDMASHLAALKSGGTTTIVLAEGIKRYRVKSEIADLVEETHSVVISEFYPDAGWAARNAMQRNATVCALAKVVVIIESGREGGTYEAGKTAQSLQLPLFAVEYPSPPSSAEGNGHFLKRGARPIHTNGTWRVALDEIVRACRNAPQPLSGQLLFGQDS